MTIFIEWDETFQSYEITQNGGIGTLTTADSRQKAISKAEKYANKGESISIKGPQMSKFKTV